MTAASNTFNHEAERATLAALSRLSADQAAKEDRDPHELHQLLESLEQAQQGSGHCAAIAPLLRGVTSAQLTPRCIVENYLYANLALVCAAGGTGKTTMLIYEAVCIAIGRAAGIADRRIGGASADQAAVRAQS